MSAVMNHIMLITILCGAKKPHSFIIAITLLNVSQFLSVLACMYFDQFLIIGRLYFIFFSENGKQGSSLKFV